MLILSQTLFCLFAALQAGYNITYARNGEAKVWEAINVTHRKTGRLSIVDATFNDLSVIDDNNPGRPNANGCSYLPIVI